MATLEEQFTSAFRCAKCGSKDAHIEELSLSGTGISRLFEVQPYTYAFVSCKNCGFTEVYNLETLRGRDDLGRVLEILFAD